MDLSDIHIKDYTYPLPEERIAQFPLEERDRSRLLVIKGEDLHDTRFINIPNLLPENSLLVWNDTRVIHARLVFNKETGARIEVFCLEPVLPSREISKALEAGPGCQWKCMVGNARKWKTGLIESALELDGHSFVLKAKKISESDGIWTINFDWDQADLNWSQILEISGKVPLPPYINRDPEEKDNLRYQTVYAANNGSVAAPTAGLHFTDEIIEKLQLKGIQHAGITLHVGAGTFKPVTVPSVTDHTMHSEQIIIKYGELEKCLAMYDNIVSVGTTTLRTLESLYWFGVKVMMNDSLPDHLILDQWETYQNNILQDVPVQKALETLLEHMNRRGIKELAGETKLMIVPGYKVRMPNVLITNFHQPHSTLLLLVAAFAGPAWRKAYEFALKNGFRFLSYGDACLFFRNDYPRQTLL
jgi:S-adenosylmethionine:tRNA ribosyltransferase-isomerase